MKPEHLLYLQFLLPLAWIIWGAWDLLEEEQYLRRYPPPEPWP